ncbi:30S ribosomal protein S8 [Candidatus Vidania fulgoroideorum]
MNDLISRFIIELKNSLIFQKRIFFSKKNKIIEGISILFKKMGYFNGFYIKSDYLVIFLNKLKIVNSLKNIKRISNNSKKVFFSYKNILLNKNIDMIISSDIGVINTKIALKIKTGGEILFSI